MKTTMWSSTEPNRTGQTCGRRKTTGHLAWFRPADRGHLHFHQWRPASYKETIDNSNAIMKAEAEKAPFKTIAYIQAQDAKKGVVGTNLPIAKEIKHS